jgi:hypothetical protein
VHKNWGKSPHLEIYPYNYASPETIVCSVKGIIALHAAGIVIVNLMLVNEFVGTFWIVQFNYRCPIFSFNIFYLRLDIKT